MFDRYVEENLPRIQFFVGKMVYWKNDGNTYRGTIKEFVIDKEEVYVIVERFLYKTIHKFKYSDYCGVWALRLNDIKVVTPGVHYDLFNYEIVDG